MISMTEAAETAFSPPPVEPTATKTPRGGARRANVGPKKGKSGIKAIPAKNTSERAKEAGAARDGSKAAKILDLLKRPEGATAKELIKVTGWQPHSIRGFLSGTVSKKLGLIITSTKSQGEERIYSVPS